jgi:hypothetical protein
MRAGGIREFTQHFRSSNHSDLILRDRETIDAVILRSGLLRPRLEGWCLRPSFETALTRLLRMTAQECEQIGFTESDDRSRVLGNVYGTANTEPHCFAVFSIQSRYSVSGVTPVRPPQPPLLLGPVDQLMTPMITGLPC